MCHPARRSSPAPDRAAPCPAPRRFPGQGAVEFSLVTLLLMMMAAGVVDLGRGVYSRTSLSNAVREAARYGATNPTDSPGIVAAAQQRAPGLSLAGTTDGFVAAGGSIRCTDRNYAWMPRVQHMAPLVGIGLGAVAPLARVARVAASGEDCLSSYYFTINGATASPPTSLDGVQAGDRVHVTFQVASTCTITSARLTTYTKNADGSLTLYNNSQGGPYTGGRRGDLEVLVPNADFVIEFVVSGGAPASPSPTATAIATSAPTATNTPNVAQTATAQANQTATSIAQTATARVSLTATAGAQQTATAGAAQTATTGANQTATSAAKTATAGAPGTATTGAIQTATSAAKTATAAPGQTATSAAKTATAVTNQTATSAAKTSTAVANQTSTAVAGQTATSTSMTATAGAPGSATVAAKTATAGAPLTATAGAKQTATAGVNQTATSVAITATVGGAQAATQAAQTATSAAKTATAGAPASTSTATSIPPTSTPVRTATSVAGPGVFEPDYDNTVTGDGTVNLADCVAPHVGKLLTVCEAYDFELLLPKLIGFGDIPMKECATVDIQSVP